jgi:HAD superfamily hydrolase (TIGR01509 family)
MTADKPAVLLDVDGTLVDSNYHHALCWHRALLDHALAIPVWQLHRHVGMGGDTYVAAVAGHEVERSLGEALRSRWEELFDDMIDDVQPLPGARELVEAFKERGHVVVIASSSIERHLKVLLGKLEIRDLVDGWTTKDDVQTSKPAPDLIKVALEKAETAHAVMVGDTPWDIQAARRAGLATVCVLTGGYAHCELSGAAAVYESLCELRGHLDEAPFR